PRPFPAWHAFILVISMLTGIAIFKMYVVSWRYICLRDLIRIVLGISLGGALSLAITSLYLVMGSYEYAFTALVTITVMLAIGGFRIGKRIFYGIYSSARAQKKHAIIFGAKSEGEQILRDILLHNHGQLAVYGMFDDRVSPGLRLHGVRVLGGEREMVSYIKKHPV